MFTIPETFITLPWHFRELFSARVWMHAQVLVMGAILCPGTRTVSAILRVMELSEERNHSKYHRVLSRAVCSARKVGQQLLKLLLETFLPSGVVVMGIDDTIERRKGKKIHAKGIYRDPVRSSDSLLVKVSGLRWLSLEDIWKERVNAKSGRKVLWGLG